MINGKLTVDVMDDKRASTCFDIAIHDDVFELTKEEKIRRISLHFKQIMLALGLNLHDDSLRDTPNRVARMYVEEIFSGLDPLNKPDITLFNNNYRYNGMLIEKNISLYSYCEHHFVPIAGKAHVAYIPNGKVIGLSKINRVVQYYSKRPQVQERLTRQIGDALKDILGTEDVAVMIDAIHYCVASRGIEDTNSSTITTHYSGKFLNSDERREFLSML
ncbi:GTP cyclohydrolase I FolE [Ilyomonas limi]|uniref:GTP cyclohydrolase 1 n=1 Tax=Ilyomonas limi TaxID=2575867 RepID=A0A4V5UWE2_9BACT|nr:GTP cyclohydrolase I FolE [Ilyomonas limi]TKK71003.1 GTP cyclohydrolase I FolE [Ilyomonas limi]